MSVEHKGLITEIHARGLRRANLAALQEQRARMLASLQASVGRGKQSRSALYRKITGQLRALAGPLGLSTEIGEGKQRQFLLTMLTPRKGVGLVSELVVVSFRTPTRPLACAGPLTIRQHALERLHHRIGLSGDFTVWAREFRITLATALALSFSDDWKKADQTEGALPTMNGALLGIHEGDDFVGRTWLHAVDLSCAQRAEVVRKLSIASHLTRPLMLSGSFAT